jgi:hypothetical protein
MRQITDFQLEALFYLINKSLDADEKTKKICINLIKASEKLTKSVYATFSNEDATKPIMYAIHNMVSDGKNTYLNYLIKLTGSKLKFSSCVGHLKDGKLDKDSKEGFEYFTIWLSEIRYDAKAFEVKIEM